LVTAFVNGIPSVSSVLNVGGPVPPASILIVAPAQDTGSFRFTFTNSPGLLFTVLMSTNLMLPLHDWRTLGTATESSPGNFQFTDPEATNSPLRLYRVYSP
jgi:hypothetical protein